MTDPLAILRARAALTRQKVAGLAPALLAAGGLGLGLGGLGYMALRGRRQPSAPNTADEEQTMQRRPRTLRERLRNWFGGHIGNVAGQAGRNFDRTYYGG